MNEQFEKSPNIRKVDQADSKPFNSKPEEKTEFSSELKKYQEEGQKFIDSYRRFFMTFAKDVSLDFKMSDGFYIDLEKGEVNLDTKWFSEKGFSKEQILWANLHELSHFRDLAEDPKKVMENFEYIRSRAKKTGALIFRKWEDKYGASDPEFIENLKKQKPIGKKNPPKTMSAVERAAYKIHHTFYNIFDDIYVNNLVARKASAYEKGTAGEEEVKNLYRKKLFAKTDYTKLPRHMQFIYKLIREEMAPNEKIAVNDEVGAKLDKKIKFMGGEYSAKEIVEDFIKPKKNKDTKAGQRHYVLRQTLEPIFEELLKKDLEEWDPQKSESQKSNPDGGQGEKGEPQEGSESGNPFEQDYQDYDKNNPDQISEEDIENWVNKKEEDKKNKEAKKAAEQTEENKSVEEKAKEAQGKLDAEWCAKNKVNSETLKQFRKIEVEVASYLEDLSKLWQRIIFGSTRKIERGMKGYFKTGTELDIQKTVEKWPEIEKGNFEEARIFKKMAQKEILIRKPELIRVRLVGDMSGSMDAAKIHILQQCFILILSSLQEFNTYLNFERSRTKSKLEADTEAWIFGTNFEPVKKFRKDSGYNEQIEIIQIFDKLKNTIGFTCDYKVLNNIHKSISDEDRSDINKGKTMEIIIEITDGGSTVIKNEGEPNQKVISSSSETRDVVDKIAADGVIIRGFQIGNTSSEEKKIFNDVWNNGREEGLGEIVGEKIENLLPAITAVLKKYLSNVKL